MRTDIPLADQVVQVGHACLEAGQRFGPAGSACHLVVLGVPSEAALQTAIAEAGLVGIRWTVFYEPDHGFGHTAACTEPLTPVYRRAFRRLPLWTAPAADPSNRGPPAHALLSPGKRGEQIRRIAARNPRA